MCGFILTELGLPDRSVYNPNRSLNVIDDNGNLCYYDFSECCWYIVETSGQGGVYSLEPSPKMWSYLPDVQFELQRAKTLQDVVNFLSDLDYELKYGNPHNISEDLKTTWCSVKTVLKSNK